MKKTNGLMLIATIWIILLSIGIAIVDPLKIDYFSSFFLALSLLTGGHFLWFKAFVEHCAVMMSQESLEPGKYQIIEVRYVTISGQNYPLLSLTQIREWPLGILRINTHYLFTSISITPVAGRVILINDVGEVTEAQMS
jgi:hypothetical protein